MAAVTIPLLNLRHNGPRGVGTTGAPVAGLRKFQKPPPDLVAAERKKLEKEKVKLVKELRSGARARASLFAASPSVCNGESCRRGRQMRIWTGPLVSRANSRS
jgi:hypothetical protein